MLKITYFDHVAIYVFLFACSSVLKVLSVDVLQDVNKISVPKRSEFLSTCNIVKTFP